LRADALVIATETFFNSKSGRLGVLSIRHNVPAIYQHREFVAAGGLMSYAASFTDAYRLAGVYTGRVLTGETPSDLPVQQVTKTELFINVSTAKALGVNVPQSLLLRADEGLE
jgi:putative ABC transport system substrate-binding protein